MSLTVPHSAIGLSDRLALIIEGLRGVVAARGAKEDASVTPADFRDNLQRLVDVLLRGLAR